VTYVPPVVRHLAERLGGLGWVTDLLVAGSLATGDYVPGVSDLDLVALTGGPVGAARQEILAGLHRELDQGAAEGLDLGCQYVDGGRLADLGALHPTWTHGSLVQRSLSGVTRAELVRHGFAVLGRPPAAVLPEMTDDDVRAAAGAELCARPDAPWMSGSTGGAFRRASSGSFSARCLCAVRAWARCRRQRVQARSWRTSPGGTKLPCSDPRPVISASRTESRRPVFGRPGSALTCDALYRVQSRPAFSSRKHAGFQ
jgi:hypothetical protein